MIRGWLDPVVANKVHFTNTAEEMEEFVPRKQILKELGGDENWEFKYSEPIPDENDKMKDVETRDRLVAERAALVKEFEQATLEWVGGAQDTGAVKAQRDGLAAKLRDSYWQIDPYLRARSYYDRVGVLLPGGRFDPYLTSTTQRSEDDVD